MEVTSSNSTPFAPKLGQVSGGSLSTESFSSHLIENDPAPRPRNDRQSDDRRTTSDDHEATARAETKASKNARAENARDRENAEAARRKEAGDDVSEAGALREQAIDTDLLAVTETEETALLGEETLTETDTIDTPEADILAGLAADVPTREQATNAAGLQTAPVDVATLPDPAAASDETLTGDTDVEAAGPLSSGKALSSSASNEAVSQQATVANAANSAPAQGAIRQLDAQTAQANRVDAIATTTSTDDANLSFDPSKQSFNTDADTDGDRGLGHQFAETLAGKNKAQGDKTATSNNAPSQTAIAPAPTSAPNVPTAVPQPTIAVNALSSNGLPNGLDFEQLGLATGGQTNSTPQNNNPVLVRFGVLPGQAQATQVPNNALALQIAKHVAKGVSTFEIRLDPAELGRIDVKLELAQDGRVTAHLAVERTETLDLLQRDAKALEQALRDAGLDADGASLNFSLKDGSSDQANTDNRDARLAGGQNDNIENQAQAEASLLAASAARQIQAAARGGIDVSI